jgi:hypothetical protein
VIEDPALPLVLEPKVGGALRFCLIPPYGTKLDPSALAGQELRLTWTPAHASFYGTPPERTLAISPDLELFAGGLSPECYYELDGRLLPFAELIMERVEAGCGVVHDVNIDLSEGIHVAGRVVDEDGSPVAEARIVAVCWLTLPASRKGWGSGETVTSADGSFALDAVHPALHHFGVSHPGFMLALADRAELGSDEQLANIEFVLKRERPK